MGRTLSSSTSVIQNQTIDNTNTAVFKDTNFTLQDDADTTRQLRINIGTSIPTGTTRTLTLPSLSGGDDALVTASTGQTIGNKTFSNSNTFIVRDDRFTLQDDADNTKQAVFNLSGISTASTRTYTLPNGTGIIPLVAGAGIGTANRIVLSAGNNGIQQATASAIDSSDNMTGVATLAIGIASVAAGTKAHIINTSAGANATALTLGNADGSASTASQIAFNISTTAATINAAIRATRTAASPGTVQLGFYSFDGTNLLESFRADSAQRLNTLNGRIKKARVVTAAGAVTVDVSTDHIIIVNKTSGAATTVNLPASPPTGLEYVIKDGKGDAATNNITITPAAGTIDGAASLVISTNYGMATIIYNGTQWNAI